MTIIQKIDQMVAHIKDIDAKLGVETKIYCFEVNELQFAVASREIISFTHHMESTNRNSALTGNSERFINHGLIEVTRYGIRFNICKKHP